MQTQTLTIINKLGLHARASGKFVQTAAQYQSEIWVSKG
ncbi:MAG: HPr family phosphocarrier protein, partial [Kingella sp. (in: b-proteobacteria)]